jgi:hypothetical protein
MNILLRRKKFILDIAIISTIPFIFIFLWLIYNYIAYGDFIFFVKANSQDIKESIEAFFFNPLVSLMYYPFLLFIVSPILFILIILGFYSYSKRLDPKHHIVLSIIFSQLIFIFFISLLGPGTIASPQRFIMGNVILLVPFAAFFLTLFYNQGKVLKLVVIILSILYCLINTFKSLNFNIQYSDSVKAGSFINKNYNNGNFKNNDIIFTDLAFHYIFKIPFKNNSDYYLTSSEHASLAAYSNNPNNFLFNILKLSKDDYNFIDNQTSSKLVTDKIKAANYFKKNNITKIIISNRDFIQYIPKNYILTAVIEKYIFFSLYKRDLSLKIFNSNFLNTYNIYDKQLSHSIQFIGVHNSKNIFSKSIYFIWKRLKSSDNSNVIYRLKFDYIGKPDFNVEKKFTPIYKLYPPNKYLYQNLIIDKLKIVLPSNAPNGEYSVSMLIDNPKINCNDDDIFYHNINLGTFNYVSSKRDVLLDSLRLKNSDWSIFFITLLSI